MSAKFKLELGERVKLIESDEMGVVDGRAEYVDSPASYYVMYKAADGRQTTRWWEERHLMSLEK